MRLTLRTLLAYIDDTLPPTEAADIGRKVAESDTAPALIEKIRKLTRKRSIATPTGSETGSPSDPNTVAEYLSDALSPDLVSDFESICLESEVHLAEAAACHQILTLLLSEPARVPPVARKRMYELVTGPESLPNRKPSAVVPVGGMPEIKPVEEPRGQDAALLLGLPMQGNQSFRWGLAAAMLMLSVVGFWFAWPTFVKPEPMPVSTVPESTDSKIEPITPAPKTAPIEDKSTTPMPETKPPETVVESKPITKAMPVPVSIAPLPDRRPIAKLVNRESLVLANNTMEWKRITENISSCDRLVCLPGYKSRLQTESGIIVELLGNVPDLIPDGPLESAITIHAPAPGFDFDATIQTGRVTFTLDKSARMRIRIDQRILDFEGKEKSSFTIQRSNRVGRGLLNAMSDAELDTKLAMKMGSVSFQEVGYPSQYNLPASEVVLVTEKANLFSKMSPPYQLVSKQSVFPNAERAAAAQRAFVAFEKTISDMDRVSLRLAEGRSGDNEAVGRLATFASGAIGDVASLAEALQDPRHPSIRDAAYVSLQHHLVTESRVNEFEKLMTEKYRMTAEQAANMTGLIRGLTTAERRTPAILEKLIKGLSAETLPERELSHRLLVEEVDPTSSRDQLLYRFDPEGPVDRRDACKAAWKKRVEELLKAK